MSNPPCLGIDFGTSKCTMAWLNPATGQPEVLLNAEGETRTPSVVYFGDREEDVVVGAPAEHALENPLERLRVVASVKRQMGPARKIPVGGRRLAPVEIAAQLFRKLKRDAEEGHFREPVTRAVVTFPATFDQLEQDRIAEAARLGGFEEVELLPEPVAAALAYASAGFGVGESVLVYDLGAGTFDLALLARDAVTGRFRLGLEPRGVRCGGDDFDRALYDYLDEAAERDLGRPISPDGAMDLHFLRECRKRKENLSLRERCDFSSWLRGSDGATTRFSHSLDRAAFEELIAPLVEPTVKLTGGFLEDARRAGHRVESVVLIGGSAKIPLVGRLLGAAMPVAPQRWDRMDYAVVLGAAVRAGEIWGSPRASRQEGASPGQAAREQYRLAVEIAWAGGKLEEAGAAQLAVWAARLGLSEEQAASIEVEVMGASRQQVLDQSARATPEPVQVAMPDPETLHPRALSGTEHADRRVSVVVLPRMGAAMEEGTLCRWLKKEGDTVREGEAIAEIETEKATLEIPAPEGGILSHILIQEGETVPVGTPLAEIIQAPPPVLPLKASSGAGTVFLLPSLGESVEECTVARWLKREGEPVQDGEELVEVETEKVNIRLPAPTAGILARILVRAGGVARVGASLAEIAASPGLTDRAAPAEPQPTNEPSARVSGTIAVLASPQVTTYQVCDKAAGWHFFPDGKRIAITQTSEKGWQGITCDLLLWDRSTNGLVCRINSPHPSSHWAIGRVIAVTAYSTPNELLLFDPETGRPLRTLKGYYGSRIAVSADGRMLAGGVQRGTGFLGLVDSVEPSLWDLTQNRLLKRLQPIRQGHLLSQAFSPDGGILATSYGPITFDQKFERATQFWRVADGALLWIVPGGPVNFSPDSRLAVRDCGSDGTRLWDAQSGKLLRTLPDGLQSCCFSSDGSMLAGWSGTPPDDFHLQVLKHDGTLLHTLEDNQHRGASLAFWPDDNTLAWGDRSGVLKLWRFRE